MKYLHFSLVLQSGPSSLMLLVANHFPQWSGQAMTTAMAIFESQEWLRILT